jgi:MFS family permease
MMEKARSVIGGSQAWLIWGLAVIFVVWLFNLQTGYSVLSTQIQGDLALTVAQVGLVSSIYTWAFSIVQLISGPLLDRFGVRRCMTIAVALVTAGAFFYSAAQGMGSLVIAQILLAVGAAFGFVGAGFVGGVWFNPLKYGLMFGLVQAFASLGSAIGTPLVDYFSNLYDWRSVLSAFFFFGIFLVIAFVIWVKDPVGDKKVEPKSTKSLPSQILEDLTISVKHRDVSLSALIAGVSFGLMLAFGVLWGPRILVAHGFSETSGVIATSLLWLGLAVGAPLYNVWSNSWKQRKAPFAIGILFQLAIVLLIVFLPSPTESTLMILMFLLGFSAGTHMLGFTIAGEVVPGALVGSASAIVNAVCFVFGGLMMSIPAALLPTVATLDDFQRALIIMPVLLFGAFLLSLMIRESYGKESEVI